MSGFLGALVAMVGNAIANFGVGSVNASGSGVTSSIQFNSDGTITSPSHPSGGYSGPAQWAANPVAGIGNSYWVRFTPTTGTFTSNGAAAFTQMSSNVLSTCTAAGLATKQVVYTVDIAADAGGTQILRTVAGWDLLVN